MRSSWVWGKFSFKRDYKRKQNDIKSDKKLKSKKIRLIFSILLMLILMYIAMGEMLGLKLPFNFEKIEASGLFCTKPNVNISNYYVNKL